MLNTQLRQAYNELTSKPWYQRGEYPVTGKYLPACDCQRCRRERISRLLSASCYWLNLYRGELNRIEYRMPIVPSSRVVSDGGYAVREAELQWGSM